MNISVIDSTLQKFNKSDVFTPDRISKRMASYLTNKGTLLEPAVGDGQLLKYMDTDKYSSIDIYDIKQNYLDKCPTQSNIHTHLADFIRTPIHTTYDNIILNPPYIRIQDLSSEYRTHIKTQWSILNRGNIDIYYAFILKCLDLLKDDGVMVCITPNSYLYNVSSKSLRKYIIDNRYIQTIIDYKSEKVFKNVSTYCCITVFTKQKKEYLTYNSQQIRYDAISNKEYNIFNTTNSKAKTLGDICTIKNGIATLRDKIFIHDTKLFDEPCWEVVTKLDKERWCIFPYNEKGKVVEEDAFKIDNPQTYAYLESHKAELAKRDKGNKVYPKWYSYGRTQSLIKYTSAQVMYISSFADPDHIQYKIDTPKIFSSCLCLEVTDTTYTLEKIKEILIKHKQFIIDNSSKRGGGWITISGRTLKAIPVEYISNMTK